VFYQRTELREEDPLAQWLARTGNRAQLTLNQNTKFEEDEGKGEVIKIKVMILGWDGKKIGVMEASTWREEVEEQFSIECHHWTIRKDHPDDWEEGEFEMELAETTIPPAIVNTIPTPESIAEIQDEPTTCESEDGTDSSNPTQGC
jgi:hypothetical protein